jgi:hypothetical protein
MESGFGVPLRIGAAMYGDGESQTNPIGLKSFLSIRYCEIRRNKPNAVIILSINGLR